MGLVHEGIIAIMRDVKPIGKGELNKQQGFKFRGIDTVYNELHDLMAKHGIFTMPKVIAERSEERTTKSGGNLIYRILTIEYHFYASDGSAVVATVVGEGMDSGDKASNKSMAVGHKYALLQAFCIPTDEAKDPDADTPPASTPKERTQATPDIYISEAQRKRLYAIYSKAGKTDEEVKTYLADKHKIKKSAEIPNAQYEEICNWAEQQAQAKDVILECPILNRQVAVSGCITCADGNKDKCEPYQSHIKEREKAT